MDVTISKRFKIILYKKNNEILFLSLLFFSNAAFYTLDTIGFYLISTVIVLLYVSFRFLKRPYIYKLAFMNINIALIMISFFIFSFNGTLRLRAGSYNGDYMFCSFVLFLSAVFILTDSGGYILEVYSKSAVYSAIALTIYIAINEWNYILTGGVRIGDSASGNVNNVAINLGIFSMGILYQYFTAKKSKYLFIYICVSAMMLLTGSKKGFLLLLIGMGWFLIKKDISIAGYIKYLLLMALGFYIIFTNDYFKTIIGQRTIDFLAQIHVLRVQANYSNSTHLRTEMIQIAFEAFLKHPLIGGGMGYFENYSGLGTYSHNNYTELLANFGVLGFFVFYWEPFRMIKGLLLKFRKVKINDQMIFVFLSLLSKLVIDFAAVTYSAGCLTYIVVGVAYIYLQNERKSKCAEKINNR